MSGLAGILYKQPRTRNVVLSPKGEDLADVFLDKFLNLVFPDTGGGECQSSYGGSPSHSGSSPVVLLSNLDAIISHRLPAPEVVHCMPAGVYPCERVHLYLSGLDQATLLMDDG